MKFAVMQTGPRKFIVGERACEGATYRKVCECSTEYSAKLVADALEQAVKKLPAR
jgi:hypothetical protein